MFGWNDALSGDINRQSPALASDETYGSQNSAGEQRCQVPLLTSWTAGASRVNMPMTHAEEEAHSAASAEVNPMSRTPGKSARPRDWDQSRRSDHAATPAGNQTTVPDTFSA